MAENREVSAASVAEPRTLEEWIASRPECVRRLAREFPLGSYLEVWGKQHWIIGYNESEQLIVSPVDPSVDYDASREQAVTLCASHLREAT